MRRQPVPMTMVVAILLVILAPRTSAQDETPTIVTDQNRSGDLPFSTVVGTDVEHVVTASGNLIVNVPIAHVRGRGMDFNFGLRYDGRFLVVATRPGIQYWNLEWGAYVPSNGLWQANQPRASFVSTPGPCWDDIDNKGPAPGWVDGASGFMFYDANGGKHPLEVSWQQGECSSLTWSYTNQGPDTTGDGIWAQYPAPDIIPPTILLADGTGIPPSGCSQGPPPDYLTYQCTLGTYVDSNGNSKTEAPGGTDTLGRAIVAQQNGTNQVLYKVYDSAGVQQTYTVNYTSLAISIHFNAVGLYGYITEYTGTRQAITSIVLPNGRSYSFQYDGYGSLTSLTLPTGATISYVWTNWGSGDTALRHVASRTVQVNGQSQTWQFSYVVGSAADCQPYMGSCTRAMVTDPLGNQSVYAVVEGRILTAKIYQGSAVGTPLRQYTIDYLQWTGVVSSGDGSLPIRITTQLDNGLIGKMEFDYDAFDYPYWWCPDSFYCANYGPIQGFGGTTRGNVTEIRQYAYGTGAPGPLVRRTTKQYLHDVNSAYVPYNIVSKVITSTIYDSTANTCKGLAQPCTQTQFEYDNYVAGDNPLLATTGAAKPGYPASFTTRGNITRVKRWRNTDGALLTTTYQYDNLGNIRATKDPLGHATTYSYTDNWANSVCLPPAGTTAQAYVYELTNALNQKVRLSHFPCTGLTQSRKDQNDINAASAGTTFTYDLLGRPTQKNLPDGGQVTTTYNDVPPVSVTTTTKITTSLNLVTMAIADGLRRTTQSKLTSDPQGTVFTDTTYDLLGRAATVSNPYRSTSEPTFGVTTTQFDALSRVTKLIPPDGSGTSNNVTTTYSGNCTTVTDQAGKIRKSCTDALGRLIQVFEPDSSGSLVNETDYQYDTLDNLTRVDQKGNDANSANWRTRTFTYNSLSQLLTASNPESGTISYAYDNDGNLLTKTAPAPNQTGSATVTTTFSYDALHRLTNKSYSDGTSSAFFTYDVTSIYGNPIQNPVGRMVAAERPCHSILYSYDPIGRVTQEYQYDPVDCGATGKVLSYSYDLMGSTSSATNGAGVAISYAYNGAARPTTVTSSFVDAQHPATLFTADPSIGYYPHGALRKATLGNGLTLTDVYNNRLQPCLIDVNSSNITLQTCADSTPPGNVLDFYYGYNEGVSNNGNIVLWNATGVQTSFRSFGYDSLNRLQSMSDSAAAQACKGLSWTYDIWGNRTDQNVTAGSCGQFHATVNTQNRLVGPPYQYDAAGNLTYDGSHSYAYDAENRIVSVDGGATANYVYDAQGRRTAKVVSGIRTRFLYDLAGNVVAEIQNPVWTVGYVYVGGSLLAQYQNSTTYFVHKDHLGSTRVMTALDQSVFESMDFLPFGEQIAGDTATTHKLTGKERDTESGLDFFGARYYASNFGRFTSADEFTGGPVDAFNSGDPLPPGPLPYADIDNPQSLNKYAYTYNNPLRWTDPNGHCIFGLDTVVCVTAAVGAAVLIGTYAYSHFKLLHAKAEAARAAKLWAEACAGPQGSNSGCDPDEAKREYLKLLQDAGEEAQATGIAVTPMTGVPTTPGEVIVEGVVDTAKEAAIDQAKKKAEEQRRKQEEQQRAAEEKKKKEEERRKKEKEKEKCQPKTVCSN